jgi:hypothetical protein
MFCNSTGLPSDLEATALKPAAFATPSTSESAKLVHSSSELQFARSLKPIHNRHRQVQNDQIRAELLGFADCIAAVLCFKNPPIGILVKDIAEACPHEWVVVGNEDTLHMGQVSSALFVF